MQPKRANIFKGFLEETNTYIDYNGIEFTLATKTGDILTITQTGDEIYLFILGYIKAQSETLQLVNNLKAANEELTKQNLQNIENYEKIISASGLTTILKEPHPDIAS